MMIVSRIAEFRIQSQTVSKAILSVPDQAITFTLFAIKVLALLPWISSYRLNSQLFSSLEIGIGLDWYTGMALFLHLYSQQDLSVYFKLSIIV